MFHFSFYYNKTCHPYFLFLKGKGKRGLGGNSQKKLIPLPCSSAGAGLFLKGKGKRGLGEIAKKNDSPTLFISMYRSVFKGQGKKGIGGNSQKK